MDGIDKKMFTAFLLRIIMDRNHPEEQEDIYNRQHSIYYILAANKCNYLMLRTFSRTCVYEVTVVLQRPNEV
jgi:hypothetical protein